MKLYFGNIRVDWEEEAAPYVCRILFRPSDFLQLSRRKLPAHLRALYTSTLIRPDSQIYSILHGSAAAAECRLSILGYSRSRAEEAWNSAKTEVLLNAERDEDSSDEFLRSLYKKIANFFNTISYKQWQTRYINDKLYKNGYNSAEVYLSVTQMASDPLMLIAVQFYALQPTELWADITAVIDSEEETKDTIFGEDKAPDRLS
jgi:hypothetical protein